MANAILLAALLVALPVAAIAIAPTADACLYVYTEVEVGPVMVEQRSTCSAPRIYVDGDPLLP